MRKTLAQDKPNTMDSSGFASGLSLEEGKLDFLSGSGDLQTGSRSLVETVSMALGGSFIRILP